uniref:Uncharacterized protein n=1 Tax=Anguilla anguilla TaxID=7936 RepID=A0A0E9S4X0_ANGAN
MTTGLKTRSGTLKKSPVQCSVPVQPGVCT